MHLSGLGCIYRGEQHAGNLHVKSPSPCHAAASKQLIRDELADLRGGPFYQESQSLGPVETLKKQPPRCVDSGAVFLSRY